MKHRNIISDSTADFITDVNSSRGIARRLAKIQDADLPTGIYTYEDGDLVFLNKAGENAKLAIVYGDKFAMNYGEAIPLFEFSKNKSVFLNIPVNAAEHIPATYNPALPNTGVKEGDPVYVKYVVGTTGTAEDYIFVGTETDNTKGIYKSQVIYFTPPATNAYKIGTFAGPGIDGGRVYARVAIDPDIAVALTRSIAPMAAAMDSETEIVYTQTEVAKAAKAK